MILWSLELIFFFFLQLFSILVYFLVGAFCGVFFCFIFRCLFLSVRPASACLTFKLLFILSPLVRKLRRREIFSLIYCYFHCKIFLYLKFCCYNFYTIFAKSLNFFILTQFQASRKVLGTAQKAPNYPHPILPQTHLSFAVVLVMSFIAEDFNPE